MEEKLATIAFEKLKVSFLPNCHCSKPGLKMSTRDQVGVFLKTGAYHLQ
jgi:hypothetical protein